MHYTCMQVCAYMASVCSECNFILLKDSEGLCTHPQWATKVWVKEDQQLSYIY